jgi:hypothetical protein
MWIFQSRGGNDRQTEGAVMKSAHLGLLNIEGEQPGIGVINDTKCAIGCFMDYFNGCCWKSPLGDSS